MILLDWSGRTWIYTDGELLTVLEWERRSRAGCRRFIERKKGTHG